MPSTRTPAGEQEFERISDELEEIDEELKMIDEEDGELQSMVMELSRRLKAVEGR